jgi:hypothetical protein
MSKLPNLHEMAAEGLEKSLTCTDATRNKVEADKEEANSLSVAAYLPKVPILKKTTTQQASEHLPPLTPSPPKRQVEPEPTKASVDELAMKRSMKKTQGQSRAPTMGEPKQPPPPISAMKMRVDDHLKENKQRDLNNDSRMGWVGGKQYTITPDWEKRGEIRNTFSPELIKAVAELWFKDRWNNLINPPEWVTIDLFMASIPSSVSNQEAATAVMLASTNLDIARARMANSSVGIINALEDSDYQLVAPIDNLAIVIKDSELMLKQTLRETTAIHAAANDALISAETYAVTLRNRVKASVEDVMYSTDHKISQMLAASEKRTGMSDVESGAVMSGLGRHQSMGSVASTTQSITPRSLIGGATRQPLTVPDPQLPQDNRDTMPIEKGHIGPQ